MFMEYGPFRWCHSPLHDVTSDSNTIPVWIFVLYLLLTQLWFCLKPKDFPWWFMVNIHIVFVDVNSKQFYTYMFFYDMICIPVFFSFCPSHEFPKCLLTFGHLERTKSFMLHKTMRWAIWQLVELATIRWCTKQMMVRFTDCQLLNRISEPSIVLHLNGTVTPQGNPRSTPKASVVSLALTKSLFHGEVAWDSQKICKTTLQVKSGDAFMLS